MTDPEIIKYTIEEVEKKSWGVTQQFLEIHELLYEDNNPKIAHIDQDNPDGTAIVYFPVKDEKFYFTIYVKTSPAINISWVGTEGGYRVYFKATSDNLNFGQLAGLTVLKPTNGWNKGDLKSHGNSSYS